MINYLNQTQIKFKVDDRNITNFTLSLVDDNGSFINFNNSDSYITLQIDIVGRIGPGHLANNGQDWIRTIMPNILVPLIWTLCLHAAIYMSY